MFLFTFLMGYLYLEQLQSKSLYLLPPYALPVSSSHLRLSFHFYHINNILIEFYLVNNQTKNVLLYSQVVLRRKFYKFNSNIHIMDLESRLKHAGYSKEEASFLANHPEFSSTKNMLSLRIEIVKNYINNIESNPHIKPNSASLQNYLMNFSAQNIKVTKNSSKSMSSLAKYDFENQRTQKNSRKEYTIISFTHGMPTALKQQVIQATQLLPLRTKIVKNFINHTNKITKINLSQTSLTYYLCNFNSQDKKVNTKSLESLISFHNYNFAKKTTHKNISEQKNHRLHNPRNVRRTQATSNPSNTTPATKNKNSKKFHQLHKKFS